MMVIININTIIGRSHPFLAPQINFDVESPSLLYYLKWHCRSITLSRYLAEMSYICPQA